MRMSARAHEHLSFRDTDTLRDVKIRLLFLLGVFLLSSVFFFYYFNHKSAPRASEMDEATLPTIMLSYRGMEMNELHGYLHDMDASFMRDTLTPLSEDRSLPFTVNTYGRTVDSISYEIRSIDTTRKIDDTQSIRFEKNGDRLTAAPVLSNLLEDGEEYLIILTLALGDDSVRYYTRILPPKNEHINECIAFAEEFHNTALSDDYSSLGSYLETNYNLDTTSLSNVSILSSLDQVGWHGFKGTEGNRRVLSVGDIGSDYVALRYNYQMMTEGSVNTFYNVEEYFKVRYTSDRMYLLDYERSMDEILNPKNFSIADNVISIGVCDDKLSYLSNETGTIVSFVTAGDLYEYNQNTNTLINVFSFRGDDASAPRENYSEHNIRILSIDENGSMDYVVYGYMNAGVHEGYSGINLYHFDASSNSNTEEAFVISTRSYQVLNSNFSDLIYLNSNNNFYMLTDGNLVRVNLGSLEFTTLLSGLKNTQYAVSSSGRYIAWIEGDVYDREMTIMDLADESKIVASAPEQNDRIRPLAFLQDNIVYALLHEEDIDTSAAGAVLYPAYKLVIADYSAGVETILKEYERSGKYITDVQSTNFSVSLTLIERSGNGFINSGSDTIQNTSGEGHHAVTVSHASDGVRVLITTITLAPRSNSDEVTSSNIKSSELFVADSARTIEIPSTETILHYYVYVGSHIALASTNVTDAIARADKEVGLVVDTNAKYIWNRSRAPYVNTFRNLSVGSSDQTASTSAQALSAMLVREGENVEVNALLEQGETPLSILSNTLKDVTVLDLTQCTLREVLYYINIGSPVYARIGENEAVLLVGYDSANVVAYYPAEDKTRKLGLNDASALFEEQGNVFISYIP